MPGSKEAFRLIGTEGVPLLDLIIRVGEQRPAPGKRMLCRHPFDEKKRVYVTPTAVIPLLRLVWKGSKALLEERLTTDALLEAEAPPAPAPAPAPSTPMVSPGKGAPPLLKAGSLAHIPPSSATGPVPIRAEAASSSKSISPTSLEVRLLAGASYAGYLSFPWAS